MYIKSIKAQGFKSFADKLELDFEAGINAIVGPNGSGKSNVVDAILWVLGEQSVKSLRGDASMADVIFNGSNSRDECKKASVAILFDNTDKRLNCPLNEIEIKRVIYKSGENEYYINNSKVRLKDINDLLLDVTGKFNIISQGNIKDIVDNKSTERRVLFESAAGVLKYKKRKEESLRKLDGTKENLTRVNLIIKELNTTLEPLEKQKNDAKKYLSYKDELENVEISLMASDIANYTSLFNNLKLENDSLHKQLDNLDITHPISLEKKKLESVKLDEEIDELNKKLISLSSLIADLNSQKTLSIERSRYNLDKATIDKNLLDLNEEKLNLEKNIFVCENEIKCLKDDLSNNVKLYNTNSDDLLKIKVKLTNNNNEYNLLNKEILYLQNKINIEKENLENNNYLPKSVSSILSNPRLRGVHNTIGKLIEINESHILAINTSLGASSNFIVTNNMDGAKEAIEYLKENHLGRATFFPIDTIKSRYVGNDVKCNLENYNGFIGIASDLVNYDVKYKNIIENQLGNVLVIDNIQNMLLIAKNTGYVYKLVSLEGDIIYPGGSLCGGTSSKENHNRNELNNLISKLDDKKMQINSINTSINYDNDKFNKLTNMCENLNKKITELKISIEAKDSFLIKLKDNLKEIESSLISLNSMGDNSIDDGINNLIKQINDEIKNKELVESNLKRLQSRKFDLTNEINDIEKDIADQTSSYHKLENKINNNDVEIGKYEVKIDNLLTNLANDYNKTYENAINNYPLTLEENLAREKVSYIKNELKKLVNVNVGSIDEYDRLKKRYDFLDKQKQDLEASSGELYDIISEMDNIMKDKFKKTFDEISEEFSKVFRVMFKGGNGLLKLTDENDLLNTGISILAVPPGKKLNSTASLSGGEKTLTALCLIFAILNVRPVPFIVLDEAEAALDEENVNMFGEYLVNMKHHSQFVLITHKKTMMEYADVLYGITMQESGVSKKVGVKLEDKEIG